MLTQPDALQMQAGGLQLVRRSIWKYFCDVDEAKGILSQIQALGFTDAKMVDGNLSFFGDSLVYNSPRVQAWFIEGTMKRGDDVLTVNESAGYLLDRITHPNPFVDRNADGTLGGSALKVNDIGNGYVELSWGK